MHLTKPTESLKNCQKFAENCRNVTPKLHDLRDITATMHALHSWPNCPRYHQSTRMFVVAQADAQSDHTSLGKTVTLHVVCCIRLMIICTVTLHYFLYSRILILIKNLRQTELCNNASYRYFSVKLFTFIFESAYIRLGSFIS